MTDSQQTLEEDNYFSKPLTIPFLLLFLSLKYFNSSISPIRYSHNTVVEAVLRLWINMESSCWLKNEMTKGLYILRRLMDWVPIFLIFRVFLHILLFSGDLVVILWTTLFFKWAIRLIFNVPNLKHLANLCFYNYVFWQFTLYIV